MGKKRISKTTTTGPTAYSYIRFSTPDQAQGDSERRQVQDSKEYAQRRGLILDDKLIFDKGVSGYTGKNVREGTFNAHGS